jgi:hypothetical protein
MKVLDDWHGRAIRMPKPLPKPGEHLTGRLTREGQLKNAPRLYALLDQAGRALRQGGRFP